MTSYWSYRPCNACPAINYFKVTFFITFTIWSVSYISGCWWSLQSIATSGGYRGGARGARPPLSFGLNWGSKLRAEKNFCKTGPPPYLRVRMTAPHLSEGLDQPLATDDRKRYQCQNIVLNNKTGPLVWNSIDAQKKKRRKKNEAFEKDSK